MKRKLLKVLPLIAIFYLSFSAQKVLACQCFGEGTPYGWFKDSKTVFVGKVISVKDSSGKEIINDKSSDPRDYFEKLHSEKTVYYHFTVQEWLKGAKESEVIVALSMTNCEFGFDLGSTILVYAYESNGNLWTNIFCSRTSWIESAQADIHFIHELLKNKPEPRIYGSVQLNDKDLSTNSSRSNYLQGIKIIAQNKKRQFIAFTDKNGLYRFNKLPNGKYKVYPDLPNRFANDSYNLQEIILQTKGEPYYERYERFIGQNAYSGFQVRWNNKISGKVLDADGKPLENATVKLIPVNRIDDELFEESKNKSGNLAKESPESNVRKYETGGHTPGKYYLAVEIFAPFISGEQKLRIYYPQMISSNKAEVINLQEFDKKKIDLKLPDGFVVREIDGTMFWDGGFPNKDGYISLEKLENSNDPNNIVYDSQWVKNGKFKLQVFENAEYWLHAKAMQETAKPIKIKVGKTNIPIKITLPEK